MRSMNLNTDVVIDICRQLDLHSDIHSCLSVIGIYDCRVYRFSPIPTCVLPFFDAAYERDRTIPGDDDSSLMSWNSRWRPEKDSKLHEEIETYMLPSVDMSERTLPYGIHYDSEGRVNLTQRFIYTRGHEPGTYRTDLTLVISVSACDHLTFFGNSFSMLAVPVKTSKGLRWIRATALLSQCFYCYETCISEGEAPEASLVMQQVDELRVNGRVVFTR